MPRLAKIAPADWDPRLRAALGLVRLRDFALRAGRCPFCGPTLFVKLRDDKAACKKLDVEMKVWMAARPSRKLVE